MPTSKAAANQYKVDLYKYQIAKANYDYNNQQQAKAFAYQQSNQNYQDAQNIDRINAQASAEQAQINAEAQKQISAIRSQSSMAIAGINAREKMLNPQFKQDKYGEVNPKILGAINNSRQNYGMYNALGGDKPVSRSSLGLGEQMHSGAQIADMNNVSDNTYSSALQRSNDKLSDKYKSQGYGSDSPILSGLLDSQAGLNRTMQEGTTQKNYTDTKTNNQQYGLDSNALVSQRQATLADLKSSTQQGNSSLLGLLGKGL
jgi:hypothetical protein